MVLRSTAPAGNHPGPRAAGGRQAGLSTALAGGLVLGTVLLAGPVVMVWLAWQGPYQEVRSWARHPMSLVHAFGRPVDSTEFIAGLLLLGGVVWCWILVCVVVEADSWRRGVVARHLPASGRLQQLVGVVVGGTLAILPAGRVGALPFGGPPSSVMAGAGSGAASGPTAVMAHPDTVGLASPPTSAVASDGEPVGGMYVVQPGDTLWSIAEEQLHDPLRWRDVAALNQGRLQPDGQRLVDDNWILPGWLLLLPAIEGGTGAAVGTTWTAPSPPEPPGVVADAAGVAAPMSGVRGTTGADVDGGMGQRAHRLAPAPHRSVDPTELVEFGLLAAGVIGLLDRLRRVQQRHRPTGLRIALPPEDAAALERQLRRRPGNTVRVAAGAVFAELRGAAASAGQPVPPVAAVRIGPTGAEVQLDPGASMVSRRPLPPFQAGSEPGRWWLPSDPAAQAADGWRGTADQSPAGAWSGDHLPATAVTLGRDGDDLLVVDLATLGVLAVDDPRSAAVCQAMAIELATTPSAEDLELVLVGFPAAFDAFDRVRRVDDLTIAGSIVDHRIAEHTVFSDVSTVGVEPAASDPMPAASGCGSAEWGATVVIAIPDQDGSQGDDRDGEAARRLVELTEAGAGCVAAVLGWPVVGAPWRLTTASGGRTELSWRRGDVGGPPDVDSGAPVAAVATSIDPQRVGDVAAARLATAVRTASELAGVDVEAPPYGALGGGAPGGVAPMSEAAFPPGPIAEGSDVGSGMAVGSVEVRVLGPVEVVGAERPFTRAWTLDLIVYLALHPGGATTDQWSTALWPDRLMAPASLHSTASAARRALGGDATGADHLPRSHGRLQLRSTVTTDWRRFQEWSTSEDPAGWLRALGQVRGRPLDGLRAVDWALLEGVLPGIEASVVDVAHRYAHWCLRRGDAAGAQWAARRGLLVSPYDERLYRVLFRAADLAGNPAGVEAAMGELVRLVAEDIEPFDAVHPETLELYRALSRRGDQPSAR